MRILLSLLVLVLIGLQTFSLDASLAPGLSVKNALLYVTALSLMIRMVLSGGFRAQLLGLQGCFAFLLVYATVSWLAALLAIRYPGYEFLPSAIALKNALYDHAIFFFVFFYAARSLDDALAVTDALLVGVFAANVITVLDASGVLGWNIIPVRTEYIEEMGRVQGAFGESNQHAAIAVLLLPAFLAKSMLSRGVVRLFWMAGALFAVAAVFMTASRGAILGIVLASIWGAFLFRRFISFGKLTGWIGIATLLVSVVLIGLSSSYTELLTERVFGLSFSGDSVGASSGRTEIWATAIARMMESPWTFITGFGWNVYSSMDFEFAPHNTYLGYWFNLGLPGVLAVLLIFAQALLMARSTAEIAPAALRPYMVAFVVGFLALVIAIFFVEMTEPWLYVWAYVGLSMRAAIGIREQVGVAPTVPSAASPVRAARKGLGRQPDVAPVAGRPVRGLGLVKPAGLGVDPQRGRR